MLRDAWLLALVVRLWFVRRSVRAEAGWIVSPASSSTVVTGCWASQSIWRSGWRSRSSRAMTLKASSQPIGT